MSTKNDGGPAFPEVQTDLRMANSQWYGNTRSVGGMSLRDWFAGMALQGYIADNGSNFRREALAKDAYAQADAMIAERAK
jgi:hypothetical protein